MTSIGYVPQYPIPSSQILDNAYELHEGIVSLDFDPHATVAPELWQTTSILTTMSVTTPL